MPKTVDGAREQAEAMVSVIEAQESGAVHRLAVDPFVEIENWAGLTVKRVPQARDVSSVDENDCSVAGGYSHSPRPILIVAESMSLRRQYFTVLHELGHHLQQNDDGLATVMMRQKDDRAFEEAACDAFAARVLLAPGLVAECVDGGVTAEAAVALFNRSGASRAAICVRLIQELKSPGVIAVVAPDAKVSFAESRGDVFPPARDSDQGDNPLIQAALRGQCSGRVFTHDSARITYSTGGASEELYGQAAWCEGLLFAVMVSDSAPWKKFSPPRTGTAHSASPDLWSECPVCGQNYRIKTTCIKCGEPKCPALHCGCTTASDRTCSRCFMVKTPNQFQDGSTVCIDCE
jgi:hypothetical protein